MSFLTVQAFASFHFHIKMSLKILRECWNGRENTANLLFHFFYFLPHIKHFSFFLSAVTFLSTCEKVSMGVHRLLSVSTVSQACLHGVLKSSQASGAKLIIHSIWPYQQEMALCCEGEWHSLSHLLSLRPWGCCVSCSLLWKDLWKLCSHSEHTRTLYTARNTFHVCF